MLLDYYHLTPPPSTLQIITMKRPGIRNPPLSELSPSWCQFYRNIPPPYNLSNGEQDQQSSSPAFCNLRSPSDDHHDNLQKGRKTGKSQTKSTLSNNLLPGKGLPCPQQIKTNPKCIITTSTSINTQGLSLETPDSSSCNLERGKKKTVFNTKPTQTYRFPTIALSNVRSLNNKTEDMEVFLRKRNIDVMCMTETWISSSALAIIDGYSCYISPRCSASGEPMTHGGGVGFYCKENMPHRILDVSVPKTHDIEVSWLWARPKGLPRQIFRPRDRETIKDPGFPYTLL
ncbi:hypothetical protein QYM36_014146 [Artemia franciscana]|uniref:Uncharacterized protein n=1 Tax=Artemia franciscana TaxID=6661 RepID=A0AA88HMJ2_ARTSF|nr:hypothetical protein QYM36_014146 [Artemia franciscana]